MAVLIEAISVVVPVSVLEDKYPGGLAAYERDCPNRTFCCDGGLTRVGFMVPEDVKTFVESLVSRGLTPFADGAWHDVAVVEQQSAAPTEPCPWLVVARKVGGLVFACLGSEEAGPIEISTPAGWTWEGSLSQTPGYLPEEEFTEHFVRIGVEGCTEIWMDRRTGKKKCIGRPFLTENDPAREADEARLRAIGTRAGCLDAESEAARSGADRARLMEIYDELEALLRETSEIRRRADTKLGVYVEGYVNRVLRRWEAGAKCFREYLKYEPFHVDAWLELTWCLSETSDLVAAEAAARRTIELFPGNAGAWGNLALVLMRRGERAAARAALDRALELDPEDAKNRLNDEHFDEHYRILSARSEPERTRVAEVPN